MTDAHDFAPAIAACFDYDKTLDRPTLVTTIQSLFDEKQAIPPSKVELRKLNEALEQATGGRKIALVYGGATKVKDYVFEAPKLPEIRGASAVLDWVNNQGLKGLWHEHLDATLGDKQLVKECIIYAGGGNFLAFTPVSVCRDKKLPDKIEQLYTQHTLTAQSAAVMIECSLLELRYGRNPLAYWIQEFKRDWASPEHRPRLAQYYYDDALELDDRFFQRKTFNELVTLLNTLFYRRREEREAPTNAPESDEQQRQLRDLPRYEMLSWAQKCATSDVRPSMVTAKGLPNDPLLSEASARKAYIGRKVKRTNGKYAWFEEVFDWRLDPLPNTWEEKFRQHISGSPYDLACRNKNVQPAQDVGEIAQASHRGRYIGLIYADGNNVARYIGVTKTLNEYAQKSQQLSDTAQKTVFHALATCLRPTQVLTDEGKMEWVHPFEILTIGGDDLLLIVPGNKALDIALEIGLAFEKTMGDEQQTRELHDRYKGLTHHDHTIYKPIVGLSAGVVIAQESTPIFFLQNLVEQLLKNAKKMARDGDGGGAIDFMVMKSITMVTNRIDTFREQALGDHRNPTDTTRRRTARPYTWHEFDGLLQTARALRAAQFPRSQLYRLRGTLDTAQEGGVLVSALEYLSTRSRLKKYSETLLTSVEGSWHSSAQHAPMGAPPWLRMPQGGWETIWLDLAEIYDLLAEEQHNA